MTRCRISGCKGKHHANGLCRKHYGRVARTGLVKLVVTGKARQAKASGRQPGVGLIHLGRFKFGWSRFDKAHSYCRKFFSKKFVSHNLDKVTCHACFRAYVKEQIRGGKINGSEAMGAQASDEGDGLPSSRLHRGGT